MIRSLLAATLLASTLGATTASAELGDTIEPTKLVGWYGFEVTADKPVKCRKITAADAKSFEKCSVTSDTPSYECQVNADKGYWVYKTSKACAKAHKVYNSDEYQG